MAAKENDIIEIGYYLSKFGISNPPKRLNTELWKNAYLKFYGTFGKSKTEGEFANSLKNIRDTFDSHFDNNRVGWLNMDGSAIKLSEKFSDVFNRMRGLNEEELWNRIRPFVNTRLNNSKSDKASNKIVKNGGKYFKSEFSGIAKFAVKKDRLADFKHGLVVDCLFDHMSQYINQAALVFNTKKIDLAIEKNGILKCIFEVKTKIDSQSIYTGVGQLIMHSSELKNVVKVLVLPSYFENIETLNCLSSLGIKVLKYSITGEKIEFEDLDFKFNF